MTNSEFLQSLSAKMEKLESIDTRATQILHSWYKMGMTSKQSAAKIISMQKAYPELARRIFRMACLGR